MRNISSQYSVEVSRSPRIQVKHLATMTMLWLLVLSPAAMVTANGAAFDAGTLRPDIITTSRTSLADPFEYSRVQTQVTGPASGLAPRIYTDTEFQQYVKVAARYKYRKRRYGRRYQRKSSGKKTQNRNHLAGQSKIKKGPIQIFVSLSKQRLSVYRDGEHISSSRISSGQRGYRTPTGIFTILQKRRRHYSNIYNGASMPYMQRITWSGIALHAGYVPNYAASHGCIRLPYRFARSLFGITNLAGHVVVAHDVEVPAKIEHASLFQPTTVASLNSSIGNYTKSTGNTSREIQAEKSQTSWEKIGQISIAPLYKVVHQYVRRSSAAENSNQLTPEQIRVASVRLMDFETEVSRRHAIALKSRQPLRILITRRTGRERIVDVQRALNQLGYDTGNPDGDVGPNTVAAVKSYQKANDLKVTGELSEPLMAKVFEAAGIKDQRHGHIYIRQKSKDIFDTPIELKNPDEELGTHLFTAMSFEPSSEKVVWNAVTIQERKSSGRRSKNHTNHLEDVLERIKLPSYIKAFISDKLTPGSSLIITDNGISHETGKYTDFIVLTR